MVTSELNGNRLRTRFVLWTDCQSILFISMPSVKVCKLIATPVMKLTYPSLAFRLEVYHYRVLVCSKDPLALPGPTLEKYEYINVLTRTRMLTIT